MSKITRIPQVAITASRDRVSARRRRSRVADGGARLLARVAYVIGAAFEQAGMVGLLDERWRRRGLLKLSLEVLAFLQRSPGD